MTPASLALLLLFVAIPGVMIGVLLRRARPLLALVRQLSDPAGVGALLSPATREALARAGHDPDALRAHAELSPELRRMVSADVSRAFRAALVQGSVSTPHGWEASRAAGSDAQAPAGLPTPPPPYAAPEPGAWLRWAAAAAVIAAAALYLALAR